MGEVKISSIPQGHHLKVTHSDGFEKVWYMGYYFKWPGSDFLSKQVMNFKRGDTAPREAFGNLAAGEFGLMGRKFDFVIRALGSKELVAQKGNKVAAIAKDISDVCKAHYHPNLVRKTRHIPEIKYLSKEQRKAELQGVYEIYQPIDLNHKKVLVVDDVFTFGTTMEAIGDVLGQQNPEVRLFGFALVHNWHKGENGIVVNEPAFVSRYNKVFAKAA
jgi:predicted amidophosphoribosyltransferase